MLLIKSWRKGARVNPQEVLYYGVDVGGKNKTSSAKHSRDEVLTQPRGQLQLGIMGLGETGPK